MIDNETALTLFLCRTFLFMFFLFLGLSLISLLKPSWFVSFKLPNNRFLQCIILLIIGLICFALAHVFIPRNFP